ncbi:MAG: symmetrical bis(5'-nucleosyl)-tetraphosphatase [Ghiorsea sp.]
MAVYAVGDIQGCFEPLKALLKQVNFTPDKDVLWCCGDMVNRGPDSLKVLRFLKNIGESCVCVLGNHDIQLLAYAAGGKSFAGDTLDEIVKAKDADELIEWLRFQPLLHDDEVLGWSMVHAGLSPLWSLKKVKKRAAEIETVLRSDDWKSYCLALQGKEFPSQDSKNIDERNLFSTAVFTRTRFCDENGVFDWKVKTSDAVEGEVKPWFLHSNAKWKKQRRIVFGHWAAKGLVLDQDHVLGLDSGCVWGGKLTMAKIDEAKEFEIFSQACEKCLNTR